jgi:Ca2+-binding RTX toxin-like protein
VLQSVATLAPDFGAGDDITTGTGADTILAGMGDDVVIANAGETELEPDAANIVIGDNGELVYDADAALGYDSDPGTLDLVRSIDPQAGGGNDAITTGASGDIIIGGDNDANSPVIETIVAGDGDNLVLGDNGAIRFHSGELDLILSTGTGELDQDGQVISDAEGGDDEITTGAGADIIVAGYGADSVDGGDGDNIVMGDSGELDYSQGGGVLQSVATLAPDFGAGDDITTGTGADSVLGGAGGDDIDAGGGDNLVLGDHGLIDYVSGDADASDMDVIRSTDQEKGGADTIVSGAGNDIVIGGAAGDRILSGAGSDLVFGDHGEVRAESGEILDNSALPLSLSQPFTFTALHTGSGLGGNDYVEAGSGDDIVLGQQGSDTIYGGDDDDDLIGGHNVAGGHDAGDRLDGGTGDDVIAGDNASILRRNDALSPRMRALQGTTIYGETGTNGDAADGLALVTDTHQHNPTGVESRNIVLLDHSSENLSDLHGDDYLAGGAEDDLIFGQLGNDTIQGDGSIDEIVDASRGSDGLLNSEELLMVDASVEAASDGDDYIEGNGGDDLIFGNLGQDDIVGDNSSLFSLELLEQRRPAGSDLIFGGAGTDIARNHPGDISVYGHAEDADVIAGDNANIYRLVGITLESIESLAAASGTGLLGDVETYNGFLSFNYDDYTDALAESGGTMLRIIPRAVELLDYTAGGPDYDAAAAAGDVGAGDEIHGESGDDTAYGQVGDDVLFGEGQDDDLIGGYGNDWISGGTGDDGVLGDDGRIYTSRNTEAGNGNNSADLSEPLYGIAHVEPETISTPGKVQQADINVLGQLKKTVNLTPFNIQPNNALVVDPHYRTQAADDIIYGGLGDDFLHGGAGDDAMSGAEALAEAAVERYPDGTPDDSRTDGVIVVTGYDRPVNLGNMLSFQARVAEEFAAYDEYLPMERISVGGAEFLLNFEHTEGEALGGGIFSDGDDRLFGDLGNDWMVGGTGRDNAYGGYGNDLLNLDDDLSTGGGINDTPDGPEYSYEDRAFGGAGRDVMIANTGGDRLIDWSGEFNGYIVPFAPFGLGTVSRAPNPAIREFLYALSASDGVDLTRPFDVAAGSAEALARNGEPEGELGLVMQKDDDWQDQTGAPRDPQPGNVPGGERDVLRGASFNNGSPDGFFVDSGNFDFTGGRLEVSPQTLDGDAVSVFHIEDPLPVYFEMKAVINAGKPTGGLKSNAFLIFDYQSPTDFKYAGVNISNDKMEVGYRDASGWHEVVQGNAQLRPDRDYDVLLSVNGTAVTLVVDNKNVFTHVFDPRVDEFGYSYGLNTGMVGIGATSSKARIDNLKVQVLPPEITLEETEDFSDGVAQRQVPVTGNWSIVGSGNQAYYRGAPETGDDPAFTGTDLVIGSNHLLQLEADISSSAQAGFIFDRYGSQRFKFVTLSAATGEVLVGYHTARTGFVIEAAVDKGVTAGTVHNLGVTLKGATVSVQLDGQLALSHAYNAVTVDGDYGLLSVGAPGSFDNLVIGTDDPAYLPEVENMLAASAPREGSRPATPLRQSEVAPIFAEAIDRWGASGLVDNTALADLGDVALRVADLPDLVLGRVEDDVLYLDVDGAGHGWFIDPTPELDEEFTLRAGARLEAEPDSDAHGDMDLLTVLTHELGHFLHFRDDDGPVVMNATLATGVRLPVTTAEGEDAPIEAYDSSPADLQASFFGPEQLVATDSGADDDATREAADESPVDLDLSHLRAGQKHVRDGESDALGEAFDGLRSHDGNRDAVHALRQRLGETLLALRDPAERRRGDWTAWGGSDEDSDAHGQTDNTEASWHLDAGVRGWLDGLLPHGRWQGAVKLPAGSDGGSDDDADQAGEAEWQSFEPAALHEETAGTGSTPADHQAGPVGTTSWLQDFLADARVPGRE